MKAKKAFAFGGLVDPLLALFMLFMIFSPVLVRLWEGLGHEAIARAIAYGGYTWMGFLFLFVCALFALDILHLLFYLLQHFIKIIGEQSAFPVKSVFFIALTLSLAFTIYGFIEAYRIRTEQITIHTSKIPSKVGKLRIAQISDVHLGLILKEEKLKMILQAVKNANPDILVSTGDLLDGQLDHLSKLAAYFREINPKYGKYAITGNHEFYAGIGRALEFMRESGFSILRGQRLQVGDVINIVGIDDPAGGGSGKIKNPTEKELLFGLPREKFTVLLKHRPQVDKAAIGLFDLQLSGHAHKGQIFPFTLIIKLLYPIDAGLLDLTSGSLLYVSRGSGTWGPPIRFLCPPEVTIIDLVSEEKRGRKR